MDQSGEANSAPFELLPKKVLTKVFSFLNAEELKTSSLVCKQWNELIGQSTLLMKKFVLYIRGSDWHLINKTTRRFKRKYQAMKIYGIEGWSEFTLTTIRKFRKDLRLLEFNNCTFQDKDFFYLECLFSPLKLEELRFIELPKDHNSLFEKLNRLHFPHLKSLAIEINYEAPRKCAPSVWHRGTGWQPFDKIEDIHNVVNFIAGQTDLEELSYYNFCHTRSGDVAVANVIFNHLPKLKTLDVDLKDMPSSTSTFYNILRPNLSLKKLTISRFNLEYSNETALAFVSKLPNIEELVLGTAVPQREFIDILATKLEKLKTIKLIRWNNEVWYQQNFSQ